MKFFVVFACLISAAMASGYGGYHIPARIDIAPGGVETVSFFDLIFRSKVIL